MSTPDKKYRISTSGTEIGAFDIDTLCTMWESEAIPKDTVYFHERSQTWKSLVKIFEARAPGAGPDAAQAPAAKPARERADAAPHHAHAESYQTPGLSKAFTKLGIGIGIVGTLVALWVTLSAARQSPPVAPISAGAPLLLGTFIATMLHLGLGQILDQLARIAFYSKRAADAAERRADD